MASGHLPPLADLLWIFLVIALTALLLLGMMGNHRPLLSQSRTRIVVGSLLGPLAGMSLVTLTLFAFKNPYWSRLFIFSFATLSFFGLSGYRLVLRHHFLLRQASGHYTNNVLLIGQIPSIERIAQHFAENVPATKYRLLGYLRVSSNQPLPITCPGEKNEAVVGELPSLGNVEQLGDLLIRRPIHEVVAIQPISGGGEWIKQVVQNCDQVGILLRIVPEALLFGERNGLRILYPFEPLHLPAVVLTPPNWKSEVLFFKRLFDIVTASLLLIVLAPLLVLIALAIKIAEPGLPLLYPWRVVGKNGVEFTGYKFRTMIANADEIKAQLTQHNEMSGPVFKIKNDPRVTPLGRFLRKYSLDEMPQLCSVIKGDMSLVGPRPAGRDELVRYEFWHKRRLSIRPGITCLWQVRGRNKISDFDEWVRMDLEYIDNWSLWLDIKILWRTIFAVLRGTGV
jgi:exopolysaccharide biosynthesis polyprenyl glycosylphosphotransferase